MSPTNAHREDVQQVSSELQEYLERKFVCSKCSLACTTASNLTRHRKLRCRPQKVHALLENTGPEQGQRSFLHHSDEWMQPRVHMPSGGLQNGQRSTGHSATQSWGPAHRLEPITLLDHPEIVILSISAIQLLLAGVKRSSGKEITLTALCQRAPFLSIPQDLCLRMSRLALERPGMSETRAPVQWSMLSRSPGKRSTTKTFARFY